MFSIINHAFRNKLTITMRYLAYNGHRLRTKNKLEKAVQQYLKDIDRTFLDGSFSFKKFKLEVTKKIDQLNQEHSRCRPLDVHWFEVDKNDWFLSGAGFSHFTIYHIKQNY